MMLPTVEPLEARRLLSGSLKGMVAAHHSTAPASAFIAHLASGVRPKAQHSDRNHAAPAVAPITQWQSAKYGMFIHWGLYSQLAGRWNGKTTAGYGEWIMHDLSIPIAEYEKVAGQFNPTAFNARQWVALAKSAGMKYLVITAKHHDGFSMYSSAASPYNIVNDTPFHRDPLAELARACKAAGIGFGVYYSIMDWHHPELWPAPGGATDPNDPRVQAYIQQQLEPQVRELVTQYNPDILWFDGEWVPWWTEPDGQQLEQFIHHLKPSIVINNRVGKRTSTDGDFDTPEQLIPTNPAPGRPWESALTLNDTWGYKTDDQNWKSSATVIKDLSDIAAGGGNLLLNVGPDGSGRIPAAAAKILTEAGKWVRKNGAAIYSTSPAPISIASWSDVTRRGNTLYAIVFNWPADRVLHLNVAGTIKHASLLGGGGKVKWRSNADGIDVILPNRLPKSPPSVVRVDFAGDPQAA